MSSQLRQLKAPLVEAENFAPYGQVIYPAPDDKPFDRYTTTLYDCDPQAAPRPAALTEGLG
ncbi:hypothetical protein NW804_07390, partial [Synechococcus sp. WC10meta]